MMKLKELTDEELVSIYNNYVVKDFGEFERKPLKRIQDALANGTYACFGTYDEDEMVGYMFLEHVGKDYLLDYIATFPEKRNGGLGARLLALLHDGLENVADSIIGEVEDPAFAKTEEDRTLQTRRLNFYLRNNLVDTGVRLMNYGVHYIIIEVPFEKTHSPEEVRTLYEKQYRVIYSDEEFKKQIVM